MHSYHPQTKNAANYWTKVSQADRAEDLVYGRVRWQCAIEYAKLAFQTLWYVIATTARLYHSSHELYVDNACEITRLIQIVEALCFHELTCYLVGYLIAPFVDDRHVYVVDEDGHLFATRRSKRTANPLFYVALDSSLKKQAHVKSIWLHASAEGKLESQQRFGQPWPKVDYKSGPKICLNFRVLEVYYLSIQTKKQF